MDNHSPSLPWDQIEHAQDSIPWSAMRTFADALVADRGLISDLIGVHDLAYEMMSDETGCGDFYVAGIFAMAAPRLDDEKRREIGSLLVERLVRAGQDDADLSLEVLMAAAGTMGSAVLPAVLDAIAAEPDTCGAWLFLWSLTLLAGKTDDPDLRSRVIQTCVDALEQADRNEIDLDSAGHPALTLAILHHAEHKELLRRLADRFRSSPWPNEYAEALDILENRRDYGGQPEMWDQPVEEWLTPRCETAATPFDETEEYEDDYDEEDYEEEDRDLESETAGLVARAFIASPIATALPRDLRNDAYEIAERILYESSRVLDRVPRAWDEPTLRKLLLEVLPGKLPADRELLEKVTPVAEALLYWFRFEGVLANGDALAGAIHGWTDQVVAAGMAPKSRDSDKPLLVEAMAAGLDPLDPEFSRIFTGQKPGESAAANEMPRADIEPQEPPIPIVERRAKISRNAPCPCGSGKKYKKCHGRSETGASAD